MDCGFLLTQP